MCGMPSYDTFFMGADGKTYALKGDQYWVIASSGGLESGPHPIADKWKELATPVNAAYTRKQDSRTFFFVGSQYVFAYPLHHGVHVVSQRCLNSEADILVKKRHWVVLQSSQDMVSHSCEWLGRHSQARGELGGSKGERGGS